MRSRREWILAMALLLPLTAAGGEPIRDNSFLVEEAYNQEPGVIQHISTFEREAAGWRYGFTEEWPLFSMLDQVSVGLSLQGAAAGVGLGDVQLNYRRELLRLLDDKLVFTPRLTATLPVGDSSRGFGTGAFGVELNLPLSLELGEHLVSHTNLGGAFGLDVAGELWVAQSLIWLALPRLNPMLEATWRRSLDGGNADELFLSPGLRAAIDTPSGVQFCLGFGFPIGLGPSRGALSILAYLSIEHSLYPAAPAAP